MEFTLITYLWKSISAKKAYKNTNITVAASFGRPWSTIEFKNISTKQIITLDVEEGSVYAFGEGRVSANQIKIVFIFFLNIFFSLYLSFFSS